MTEKKTKKITAGQRKTSDYEVGYKKPPKDKQWKPGQSGNPKGYKPPKSQQELNALLDEIFAEEMADAKGEKMTKLKIMLNRMVLHKNSTGPIHILDRRYGKIPQAVDVTSGGEKLSDLSDDQKIQRIFALIEKANRAKSR